MLTCNQNKVYKNKKLITKETYIVNGKDGFLNILLKLILYSEKTLHL